MEGSNGGQSRSSTSHLSPAFLVFSAFNTRINWPHNHRRMNWNNDRGAYLAKRISVCVCVCMCARTCVRSFLPLLLLSFFFLFFFLSFLFLVSSLLSLGAGVPMAWCLSTLPHVYRFRASFVAPPCVCRTYCHRIRYLCPLNRGVSIYIFFGLWKIWRSKNNRETRICKCMEIYYISCGKFCSKIEKDFDLSVELF